MVAAWCALGAAAACASDPPASSAPAGCEGVEVVVAASDYGSSMVCGAPGCKEGRGTTGADLGTDPSLASSKGRTFFLARMEDLVFELDPTCGTPIAVYDLYEDSGRTANPHDVAVAPDGSLWVVLYNVPRIDIFEGRKRAGTIDLSSFDPDDQNPQAEAIRIVDVDGVAKAFVALERLDDNSRPPFQSTRRSMMLRIDVATRKVEQTIELAGRNPFNAMSEVDGRLFLAEPGNFNAGDEPYAGIERFDTATSTTRLLVEERDLGGSVSEVAVTNGCGAAIVAGPQPDVNPTSLVTFDPETGKVLTTANAAVLGPTPGYDIMGLAWRGDTLYVGDRRKGNTGFPVHVFEREPGTCILHAVPARAFDLPRPPVALRGAR